MRKTYDFLAIGLGPFNLSLACLVSPLEGVESLFLDRKKAFTWHEGMLLDGTTLQNPFLADLVSMADPTSPFSYLNYCKQQGRLYTYYIRENWYLSRQEFNRYCQWVTGQLENLKFQHEVENIRYDPDLSAYIVSGSDHSRGTNFEFIAKKLVVGIGSVRHLPPGSEIRHAIHTADYLKNREYLKKCRNITIIGSGQSGAEVYRELLVDAKQHGYTLNWITRAPRFFQMENAKLTLELISPDYGNYFYGLDPAVKSALIADQRTIYNGINPSLIAEIYDLLDERRHLDAPQTRLLPNMALTECGFSPDTRHWTLEFTHTQTGEVFGHQTDGLVFATGYRYRLPAFIEGIRDRIRWDEEGRYRPFRHWAVDHQGLEIFVQNVGFQSHGLINPDLGLACYRNSRLVLALTGVDHYPAEQRTIFQDFRPPRDSGFELIARKGNAE
ncbi:lysine N(6)-hydroxylase/L-ornithine N(5)-oxygenase family protein [Brenneria corticis]|uniref:Alcaligin biosynthesis protein n=1 Tax=Brenneria corticis TaxID=2173106 RepID=A0A2U1U347_9GAMM|nr:SidA/IucD/PvdA family monooxygenase [Brenneria sp. CFCC 11842]PWC16070.1 alcaligin biosynthesis protein [Brenneria sp. CFCC 11842]